MSKKRAQKRKNSSNKKAIKKILKPPKRTLTKKNEKSQKQLSKEQIEIQSQKVETRNIVTSINIEQNNSPKNDNKENIMNYYSKVTYNDFDIYSSSLFEKLLKEESNKENVVQINEDILSNFGLTKDMRKYAFKYLSEILEQYNISPKFYFKTVSVFDSFLINFTNINIDNKKIMKEFFISKTDNNFSTTKLIIFTLCCFYIVNQVHNTRNFELKCLVNWNNKEELTFDELNKLIYDILEVIDCEINILGIYDFINIFVFDLNKRIKIISNDNIFINCCNKNVNYLAMKIEQDISINDIKPSSKALGVIMFSIEYSKFLTEKYYKNEKINFLVDNWVNNVKSLLINYNSDDIKRVIQWLNNYINK